MLMYVCPCQQGTTRLRAADGGDGLQISGVAANVNIRPTRGSPETQTLDLELTILQRNNAACYEMLHTDLGVDDIKTDLGEIRSEPKWLQKGS